MQLFISTKTLPYGNFVNRKILEISFGLCVSFFAGLLSKNGGGGEVSELSFFLPGKEARRVGQRIVTNEYANVG